MRGIPIDPQRVRRLRDKLGLTQQQLADRLGVTVGSVSRWELGKSGPIRPYLEKIEALERAVERRQQRGEQESAA